MFARGLAILLIALAASPFTAPFSSCPMEDLFHQVTARGRHETLEANTGASVTDATNVAAEKVEAAVRPENSRRVAPPDGAPTLFPEGRLTQGARAGFIPTYDRACLIGSAHPPSVLRL